MINHAGLTALAKIADGIAANPPSNDDRHHDCQMGYQDGAMAVAAAIDEFIASSPSVIGSDTCLLDGRAKPVAYLHEGNGDRDLCFQPLTEADKKYGWVETPLYARPKAGSDSE